MATYVENVNEAGLSDYSGLNQKDWCVLKELINKMVLSVVPLKECKNKRRGGGKGSQKRGLRELKNLKCSINYERERGDGSENGVNVGNK